MIDVRLTLLLCVKSNLFVSINKSVEGGRTGQGTLSTSVWQTRVSQQVSQSASQSISTSIKTKLKRFINEK